MNSPIQPNILMLPREIEPGLLGYECPSSGGLWIPFQSYLRWKAPGMNSTGVTSAPEDIVIADDSENRTLICPESGRLLIRYRVGHGFNFHLDRSPVTGSVWLDKGEWEALKTKGLHLSLNLIFTSAYQREIRTEHYIRTLEETFKQRIGLEDFEKLVEIKQWIEGHPKRRDICCYIIDSLLPDKRPSTTSAIFESRENVTS